MIKTDVSITLLLLTVILLSSSATETYFATTYLQTAPIFPDGALSLGIGTNIPLVKWLGVTSDFASNISGQLSHANYLDNHINLGFYSLVPIDNSTIIFKFTGGVYKINHLRKTSAEYFDPYIPGQYYYTEGIMEGSWTSAGISLGLGLKADAGILSIALIPTGHLVFDQGSKIVNLSGNDPFAGDVWLPHDYNTTFFEVPLEIGINIE